MLKLKYLLFFFITIFSLQGKAQMNYHFTFSTNVKEIEKNEYWVNIVVKLDKSWHMYSQFTEDGGPLPTIFKFDKNPNLELIGKVKETGKLEKKFDELFGVNVSSYSNTVTFSQKVKVKATTTLKGEFDGMVCKDEEGCMPFGPESFSAKLVYNGTSTTTTNSTTTNQETNNTIKTENQTAINEKTTTNNVEETTTTITENNNEENTVDENSTTNIPIQNVEPNNATTQTNTEKFDITYAANDCSVQKEKKDKGALLIFILGFLGGLIALLTPCVFPMIPLTVSFFTKGGKDKKEGLRKALLYGFSIIVIYVLLGLIITSVFGSDALNAMSTNVWFNVIFFIIFVFFAFSFFGFYEITLPSAWANKSDSLASKGGNLGIFFMAFTLALVSFSCTGPIIGTLLVEAATGGGATILGRIPIKPLVGMIGFSTALALPFTLFALFPQWLQSLPKSGGWMNTVKVFLGFIELALAFKFLSIADMTQNWGILKWEIFMAIWVLIFFALALYSFGIIKFPHDNKEEKISTTRKILGVVTLLFVGYLAYHGIKYQPLKSVLSGLAPPVSYNFKTKNNEQFIHFKDYEKGMAYAKANNLPVLLDFTGFGCVNCRKIEENIWTKKAVQSLLQQYVIISLYVDDRTSLPEKEWFESDATGKMRTVKTVGQKWSDFQAKHFKTNSQPYYVLVSNKEQLLNQPVDYSFSADEKNYINFLECGLSTNSKLVE